MGRHHRWSFPYALMLSAGEFTVLSRDLFDLPIHLSCSDARLHSSVLARSISPSDL